MRDAQGRPVRQLSNRSINMTIDLLSNILSDAMEHELIAANPASGRRRRLKVSVPRRTWLMPDEVIDLIRAAERIDRANSPATRERAGQVQRLRQQGRTLAEVAAERDRALDGQSARTHPSRRARGEPQTRDRYDARPRWLARRRAWRLALARRRPCPSRAADRGHQDRCGGPGREDSGPARRRAHALATGVPSAGLDDFVFPTATGRRRDKDNVRERVLAAAVCEANRDRQGRGLLPLSSGLTPHSLRRTFISLLLAYGKPVPYVQRQAGHRDARTTLNIYAQVIDTDFGARERLEWLCVYTSHDSDAPAELVGTDECFTPSVDISA